MRIGIDFDDTIVDTRGSIIEIIKRDKVYSSFQEFYELGWDKTVSFWIKYQSFLVQNAKLFPYVKESLEELKRRGHTLIGITARGDDYIPNNIELTKEYMKKNQLPLDEICFGCYPKSEKCLEKKIDLMIDDSAYICKDLEEKGISFLMHTTEENKEFSYPRFDSWREIPQIIEEWEGSIENGRGKCYTYRKYKR